MAGSIHGTSISGQRESSRPIRFGHQNRRGWQPIPADDQQCARVDLSEAERPRRTALDARRAAHALRVGHRNTLVGEIHDVDSLVAYRGADIARDALLLLGEDAKTAE